MSLFMLLFEFAYHTICIVAVVSVSDVMEPAEIRFGQIRISHL